MRKYRKISSSRLTGCVPFSKWYDAGDHLLYVESYIFSESYYRFYYKDIQRITIFKTRYMIIPMILALLFSLSVLPLVIFLEFSLPSSVLWLFMLIPFIWLVFNYPSGRMDIQTLSTRKQISASSYKRLKVLRDRIAERITQEQGDFDPDDLRGKYIQKCLQENQSAGSTHTVEDSYAVKGIPDVSAAGAPGESEENI